VDTLTDLGVTYSHNLSFIGILTKMYVKRITS